MGKNLRSGLMIALIGLAPVPLHAQTTNNEHVLELMALSKTAGACGILDGMSYFQKTTQMDGGDTFLIRFWSFEASRMGKSPEEYIKTCNQALAAYNTYWKSLESSNR